MLEDTIFSNLIYNESFSKTALPHLQEEYFTELSHKIIFTLIKTFTTKYGKLPTKDVLLVDLEVVSGYNDEVINSASQLINNFKHEHTDIDWLVDTTENFCKDKSIYNAIMDSISVFNGEDKKRDKGIIPQLLTDALSVSFDTSVGHDFLEDFDKRFEYYHKVENKLPFDIEYLNKITGGGLPSKSLNVFLGGTGTGKSLVMCHMASANLALGKSVLYITMEMAEEKIAQRIDANLLNIEISSIPDLNKSTFLKKMNNFKKTCKGRLVIKEYPTASAGALQFESLLNELKMKKKFKPDVIYIDYINICKSDRVSASVANSYTLIKSIAEELRGLAQKHIVPIISATQTNRDGVDASDLSLSSTSESMGLTHTVDLLIGLISTEELEEMGQMMFKQLKNRYNDVSKFRKFVIGIDKSKMRLYDIEQDHTDYSAEGHKDKKDKSVFDSSGFGKRASEDDNMKWSTKKMGRKDFSSLC